jgi:hypothetical protein
MPADNSISHIERAACLRGYRKPLKPKKARHEEHGGDTKAWRKAILSGISPVPDAKPPPAPGQPMPGDASLSRHGISRESATNTKSFSVVILWVFPLLSTRFGEDPGF